VYTDYKCYYFQINLCPKSKSAQRLFQRSGSPTKHYIEVRKAVRVFSIAMSFEEIIVMLNLRHNFYY